MHAKEEDADLRLDIFCSFAFLGRHPRHQSERERERERLREREREIKRERERG
jgi:hypothetical protein